MNWKNFLTKTISSSLIIFALYQIFLSLNAIFFIYPYLRLGLGPRSLVIQEGLIEKASILYATMVVNSVYGMALLLKPSEEVKTFHFVLGIIIMGISLFFVTKTPFTTDPIFEFLFRELKL